MTKREKKVIVIDDSMLKNINRRRLSKSKNVEGLNLSRAININIVDIIGDALDDKTRIVNSSYRH